MLISLLVSLALAAAKPATDPCRDDDGNNRCAPAEQQRMRTLYGVEPIAAFQAGTSRRLFYVDGYGNDVVAIEFMRLPGREPSLQVHFPKVPGEERIAPLQAFLTTTQWDSLIDASEHFDRTFAPRTPAKGKDDDDAISICLHSWVYWAEATDPGKAPRSITDDACNDSPVEQFAWIAARLARSAFPHCALLDPAFSRNEATLLRACEGLTGDRMAAAEVWNRGQSFGNINSAEAYGGIDDFAGYNIILEQGGSTTKGKAARALWKGIFTAQNRPNFYYDWIKGIDADTVVVSGGLYLSGDDDKDQIADVEMRWEKDGGTFDLEAIKIGPYRPYTRPSE